MAIDARDERLGLGKPSPEILRLVFCWTCEVAQGLFRYHVLSDNAISIVSYKRGPRSLDFPYPNYPAAFPPTPLQLVPIPEADEHLMMIVNSGSDERWPIIDARPDFGLPQHQIGGVPYLNDDPQDVRCLRCKEPMPLLATIGDDAGHGLRFTGNEYVQTLFHYCPACRAVAVYQSVD